MEVKKILCALVAIVFVMLSAIQTFAAETREQFGGININMPDISVELKGQDADYIDTSDITASLGGENLSVTDFHKYNSDDTTKVYMLVDISKSTEAYLDDIKTYIKSFVSRMGSDDSIVLITFGTNVNTILNGSESIDKVNSAIDSIECTDAYTMLYDGLYTAYQSSVSTVDDFSREYAIVFTDCKNDKLVSVSEKEVSNEYETHQLPLYIAAPSFAEATDIDTLGKIARSSGGSIAVVENSDEFNEFTNQIDNVSILKLKAANNTANGENKNLSVNINSNTYNIDVTISKSIADTTAPEVESFTYDSQNNRFLITFSENVTDLTEKGAYSVEDSQGYKWEISSVDALSSDNKTQLVMKDQILNGDYIITFDGLTDCSKEKNPLVDSVSVSVSDVEEIEEASEGLSEFTIALIIVGVVFIIGLIVAVIVICNKKKTDDTTALTNLPQESISEVKDYEAVSPDVVKHHIKVSDALRVRIKIKTGNVSEQNIETNITSSIIVGRSAACDIFIDDAKLSRQHFVIERKERELYISDLNSKNGTFVNGIRLNSRRKLLNRDKIFAGLSEILISFLE
jgi:hypothetical protein